jgi:hypothetical protein
MILISSELPVSTTAAVGALALILASIAVKKALA